MKNLVDLANNSVHAHEIQMKHVVELNRPPDNVCAPNNDASLEECFDRFFAREMGCVLPWNVAGDKTRLRPENKGGNIQLESGNSIPI